jgi:hypothetical protein
MHTKTELLAACAAGRTLVVAQGPWQGQRVTYTPQRDEALGNPDFYPWHVAGGGPGARVNGFNVRIVEEDSV